MKTILNYLEFFNKREEDFLIRILYIFLLPINFLFENFVYWYYWKTIIIRELLTCDEIVDFFDKNEFGYVGNKIYKKDLIEDNEYWDRLNLEESRQLIKKDFITAFDTLFSENISFNIEDLLTMIVTTEKHFEKTNTGERLKAKIYSVTLQFYREYFRQKTNKDIVILLLFYSVLYLGIKFLVPIFFPAFVL